jgi:hypothetical protein
MVSANLISLLGELTVQELVATAGRVPRLSAGCWLQAFHRGDRSSAVLLAVPRLWQLLFVLLTSS